ncbi:hypothetical protein [Methanosarcina horonobensis]|uniref:hypothetical protein n=1 Tax=Methanosarcina horonobensis TaxID=418008 RepID=UPI0022B870BC|nr:hypothetical protein [Methanosarcina horonobensis]
MRNLKLQLWNSLTKKEERISHEIDYGQTVEPYISEMESLLETAEETGISKRALALLLLQGDRTALNVISSPEETYRDESEKGQSEKSKSGKK